MELKFMFTLQAVAKIMSSNRTFMELKLGREIFTPFSAFKF